MTNLAALLSRVENASGPDRKLFGDVCTALGCAEGGSGWEVRWWRLIDAEAWTDAAIALAERRFPGVSRRVSWEQSGLDGKWYGCAEILGVRAVAKTEALALLAAIIKAAMETQK